ncbi:histidine phosphotransferase family protein [Nioella aestuarii]|uniref:histidine phosphotransferase family protein n=1 Tax=Nioella aestuarii TaxID=1662864 RepID=UPI003D7F43DD
MDDRHDFPLPELAELVGSRLCHDLVNPLSAISNGMELIGLSGAPRSPELDLIGSAIEDAMARIRFFRVAFGAARADETLSEREMREIVAAIFGSGRLTVDWQVRGDLPRKDAKQGFLLLNCAESVLPLGGCLSVRREGERWELSGTGRKLAIDETLWQLLDEPALAVASLPASRVQFALLARDTAENGQRVRLVQDQEDLKFTVHVTKA